MPFQPSLIHSKTATENILTDKTEIFCLAHKRPLYKLPKHVTVIWLGNSNAPDLPNKIIPLNEISLQLDAYHAFLGGSAGSYAVASILSARNCQNLGENQKVAIIMYRKFVLPQLCGFNPAQSQPYFFISQSDVEKIDLENNLYSDKTPPFLLTKSLYFNEGIYGQYSIYCNAPDILRYTAIAIEMGVISWQEGGEFLSDKVLIPGGIELGIYPVAIFLKIIDKLSAISLEFLRRHQPVCVDLYQRRAVSFCSERLGSYLLRKELVQIYGPQIPSDLFGYIYTVAE